MQFQYDHGTTKDGPNSECGFLLADAVDRAIVYLNGQAAALLGYSPAELLSMASWSEIFHPDDRARTSWYLDRLLAGEVKEYRTNKRYVSKDGRAIWASTKVSGVTDQGGLVRWVAYCIEPAEADYSPESEAAVSASLPSIITWSLKPTDNAVANVREETSESIVSRLHPDDRASFVAKVDRAVAQKADFVHEHRTICDDGSIRWMKSMVRTVLSTSGEVSGIVGASVSVPPQRNEPRPIRELTAYLEKNWKNPVSVRELADMHGLSPRSVHKYFARKGTTPRAFIKERRLLEANARLLNPNRRTTVTGVALDCGFSNLGHFARDYRTRFGELPSETLRKRATPTD